MGSFLGISAGFHDAALSVIDDSGNIIFAGHSERYSKIKNDPNLHPGLLKEIYGINIDTIAYYENPRLKQFRQWKSGQGVEWKKLSTASILREQFGNHYSLAGCDLKSYNHHLSHAAAGFQTSPFDRATVVVIDAIGEFDTASIWAANYDSNGKAIYRKLWNQTYPHSIGLFYSAMTKRVGLKPLEDEYILMGMSAYGERGFSGLLEQDFVDNPWELTFKDNLHIGVPDSYLSYVSDMDLAAGAQDLAERLITNIMRRAKSFGWSKNLVYMGGVALNCSANRLLGEIFNDIWIMPNPGDAGSSLGAAAIAYGKKINWVSAYLGHHIPGDYPVNDILDILLTDRIAGVASGRAEFGPRALGNRSILADPRGSEIKDLVNDIKQRQKFRPFAPVILEELANDYFCMPHNWSDSRYMQVIATCRHPDLFPAIVHYDGTSRVQTVPKNSSGIRELLEKWFVMTGCPMLLNTSLNIKGEPMVNDRQDADRFEKMYNIKVCS